jgi:hypothetical protein
LFLVLVFVVIVLAAVFAYVVAADVVGESVGFVIMLSDVKPKFTFFILCDI